MFVKLSAFSVETVWVKLVVKTMDDWFALQWFSFAFLFLTDITRFGRNFAQFAKPILHFVLILATKFFCSLNGAEIGQRFLVPVGVSRRKVNFDLITCH